MGIVQYLHGNVQIKLCGNTPERFLNICNANQIPIQNVEYRGGNYYFHMKPKDYKRLLPIVRKTAMRPVIVEKTGLPFVMFRYRKHQCFVIGIMLSFFIIYLLSLFVWEIHFEGNRVYSAEVLMNYLRKMEVEPGRWISEIDCDKIEKQFRREFPEITWISAEITGTRLQIFIKENDEDVLALPDSTPCDLVARKNGVVESIITRSGTPLVRIGDEVHAGDVLVDSTVNTYDDYGTVINTKKVHADADIMIRTTVDCNIRLFKAYEYKIYTGNKKKIPFLEINGETFCIGIVPKYENCQIVTEEKPIKLTSNFFLPVRYGKKEYVEYHSDINLYTKQEAEKILEEKFGAFLQNLMQKGVQILEKDVKIYENTASFSYAGQLLVLEAAYTENGVEESAEGIDENEYR